MSEMVDSVLDVMQSRGLMADEADARAVIEAMREPTESMIAGYSGLTRTRITSGTATRIWKAMIDVVLKTA